MNNHELVQQAAVSLSNGEFSKAVEFSLKAIKFDSNYPPAYMNLGIALLHMGKLEKARICYQKAIDLDSARLDYYINIGTLDMLEGKIDDAERRFLFVIKHKPNSVEAKAKLGSIMLRKRDPEAALMILKELPSDHPLVVIPLVNALLALAKPQQCIDPLKSFIDKTNSNIQKVRALHLLGKVYDKLRFYEEAFSAHTEAHKIRGIVFDVDAHNQMLENTLNKPIMSNTKGSDSEIIFIVGMPRSGTTLVEQIISSHPDVKALGETPALALAEKHLANGVEAALKVYFESVGNHTGIVLTDKTPLNFWRLDIVQRLFPKSKVVHCKRSKRDTCISCYSQDFLAPYDFVGSMEALGIYFDSCNKIMENWKNKLNIPIIDMEYEKLVRSPETEIPSLLSFCGKGLADECFHPELNKRNVATASWMQVQKPIYTDSVNRSRNYQNVCEM